MISSPPENQARSSEEKSEGSLDHLYASEIDTEDDRFNTRDGVFYPTGFVLLALADEEAVSRAVTLFTSGGVAQNEITLLRPEQMLQLTEKSRHDAGLLAQIVRAELKQMTVLSQLADDGHHFLLLKYSEERQGALESLGREPGVSRGLLFHMLAVEELPVVKEKIPGTSPFGVNEVVRNNDSDAELRGSDKA